MADPRMVQERYRARRVSRLHVEAEERLRPRWTCPLSENGLQGGQPAYGGREALRDELSSIHTDGYPRRPPSVSSLAPVDAGAEKPYPPAAVAPAVRVVPIPASPSIAVPA